MATFTDDFNRADSSDLGADWTETGSGVSIYGNGVTVTTNNTDAGAACQKVASADHYAQVEWHAGLYFQLMVRGTHQTSGLSSGATGTCYTLEALAIGNGGAAAITLYRASGVTWTSLGTASDTGHSAGETIKLEAIGDQITVYRNGTAVIGPVTDATYAGSTSDWTSFKFFGQNNAAVCVDNWICADYSPPDAGNVTYGKHIHIG